MPHFTSIQSSTNPRSDQRLDHETLDLVLDGADLVGKLTGLVAGDAASNHGARDTGRTAKGHLARDVDILQISQSRRSIALRVWFSYRDVLVLGEQRQVKNNRERSGVRSQDDQLGGTAIESLGGCRGN